MEKIIKLSFISELERNLSGRKPLLQVLIGPRQVGKTTTINHFFKKIWGDHFIYESADKVFNSDANWIKSCWSRALAENKLLVIDEIQKCENWSEIIKVLWDQAVLENKKIKCVLLGSSSLEIQKGLTESLTGRFQLIRAHHWNLQESSSITKMNLDEYLKFGGYPGSYEFIRSSQKEWADYVKSSIVSTVIEKDILQYRQVKSPALFRQAFEIIVSYPAQEISYTKLLGQIQDKGNVDLVKHYISLFEGAFLIRAIEKYSEKKIKIKASSPKILIMAPCLYYTTLLDAYDPNEKGHVFESVVGAQLVRTGSDLYYWREGNHEVDFVLKQGRKLYAIEVKSGRKKSTKGLSIFGSRFKNSNGVIIDPTKYNEFEKSPLEFCEAYSFTLS